MQRKTGFRQKVKIYSYEWTGGGRDESPDRAA